LTRAILLTDVSSSFTSLKACALPLAPRPEPPKRMKRSPSEVKECPLLASGLSPDTIGYSHHTDCMDRNGQRAGETHLVSLRTHHSCRIALYKLLVLQEMLINGKFRRVKIWGHRSPPFTLTYPYKSQTFEVLQTLLI